LERKESLENPGSEERARGKNLEEESTRREGGALQRIDVLVLSAILLDRESEKGQGEKTG